MTFKKPIKQWVHAELNEKSISQLSSELQIPDQIAAILCNRGLHDPEEAYDFLFPSLDKLPSPFLMKDMGKASQLITEAICNKRPFVVYGDYDADGICAIALLTRFLESCGCRVYPHIPDRLEEGYGLHEDAITHLYNQISKDLSADADPFLITCDTGISNNQEVATARSLGFQVIVTDHHQPPETLPEADAILNPHQKGCTFPYKHLAGAGVAFYLLIGLRHQLEQIGYWQNGKPNLKEFLDLVCLGTIADMVPLTGPNRIMTKAGLEILNKCRNSPGLSELINMCGMTDHTISAKDVAFKLAPRINAAGRMGKASRAFELLTTNDRAVARDMATELENDNIRRKELSDSIFRQCLEKKDDTDLGQKFCFVFADPAWHRGILGIAASRLVNEFHKPAILFSADKDGDFTGSARSIPGLNVLELLKKTEHLLIRYGGHTAAAGLSVSRDNFESFKHLFTSELENAVSDLILEPEIFIDAELDTTELFNSSFLNHYRKLEPFGIENREPIFSLKNPQKLQDLKIVGADSLKFSLQESKIGGIAFGMSDKYDTASRQKVRLSFSIYQNFFRGSSHWAIRAEDIKI